MFLDAKIGVLDLNNMWGLGYNGLRFIVKWLQQ